MYVIDQYIYRVWFKLYVVCYVLLCSRRHCMLMVFYSFFFFQAEDGIRDLVRSRGLGDVYKRQEEYDKYEKSVNEIIPFPGNLFRGIESK